METEQIMQVPLAQLIPFRGVNGKGQPRTHFDPKELENLAQSMRAIGFTEPVLARPIEGDLLELIGGHRRCKAAALAGLAEVSAIVRPMTDDEALLMVVVDNCNRADFQPWEDGSGFADLVGLGLTVAEVSAKVGKPEAFVRGRIKIHQGLGETARRFYLRKELTLAALELLAAIPDRNLAPVKCPYCKVVAPEGTVTCPGCAKDLSGVFRCESGNPQTEAARACCGKTNGAIADAIERIKECYGIAEKAIQTAMGFSDTLISEGALEVRTALERRLSDIASAGNWFAEHAAKLVEFTPGQREAIAAQAEAGIRMLTHIREAAVPTVLDDADRRYLGIEAAQDEAPALALAL